MKVLAGSMGVILSLSLALGALPHAAPTKASSLVALSGRASAAPALATKAPLSARAAKAELKAARGSMQSGRLADALARYESVLASSALAGESRAEALYWAGVSRYKASHAAAPQELSRLTPSARRASTSRSSTKSSRPCGAPTSASTAAPAGR